MAINLDFLKDKYKELLQGMATGGVAKAAAKPIAKAITEGGKLSAKVVGRVTSDPITSVMAPWTTVAPSKVVNTYKSWFQPASPQFQQSVKPFNEMLSSKISKYREGRDTPFTIPTYSSVAPNNPLLQGVAKGLDIYNTPARFIAENLGQSLFPTKQNITETKAMSDANKKRLRKESLTDTEKELVRRYDEEQLNLVMGLTDPVKGAKAGKLIKKAGGEAAENIKNLLKQDIQGVKKYKSAKEFVAKNIDTFPSTSQQLKDAKALDLYETKYGTNSDAYAKMNDLYQAKYGDSIIPEVKQLTDTYNNVTGTVKEVVNDVVKPARKLKIDVTKLPETVKPLTDAAGNIVGYTAEGVKKAPVFKKVRVAKAKISDVTDIIKKATNEAVDIPVAKPYDGNIVQNINNRLIRSTEGFFRKQGEAGNKFADLFVVARREAGELAGRAQVAMENALKPLSKEDRLKFTEITEGRTVADTPALQKAVDTWNTIAGDIADKASKVNLNIRRADGTVVEFAPRENFFPHAIPEEYFKNKKLQIKLFQEMVANGTAKSVAEAQTLFDKFIRKNTRNRFGNLEYSREIDLPIYEKDPAKVIFAYINGAYKRVTDAKYFGPRDERAYKLVDQIGLNGGDTTLARQMVDRIFGKEAIDPFTNQLVTGLTGFQTVTKLGLGAFTNLGQSVSTALVTNPLSTAKAIAKTLATDRQGALEFTKLTGNILETSMDDFMKQAGGELPIAKKFLRKVGFVASERFNRIVAANAGKEHATKLANELLNNPNSGSARRALERLGVNPDEIIKNGGISEQQMIRAAQEVVDSTQFKTDTFDLPYWWTSPAGKVLMQFKSFAYKQAKLINQQSKVIASEVRRGNIKPLVNVLVVGGVIAPAIGEIITNVKSVAMNKEREDEGLERYLNNVFTTLSLGLYSDVWSSVSGKYGPKGLVSLIGPTVSDIYDAGTAIQSLGTDRKTLKGLDEFYARVKPITRELIERIPVIGRGLANTFIPNKYIDNYIGVNQKEKDKDTFGEIGEGLSIFGFNIASPAMALEIDVPPLESDALKLYEDDRKVVRGFRDKLIDIQYGNYETEEARQEALDKLYSNMDFAMKRMDKFVTEYPHIEDMMIKKAYKFDTITDIKGTDPISENKRLEAKYKVATNLIDSARNGDLSDRQVTSLLEDLGLNEEDATYYYMASQDREIRSGMLSESIESGVFGKDRTQIISELAKMRRKLNNKMILQDTVITDLYENGLITKEEEKLLKAVKYEDGVFSMERNYSSGGSNKTKVKAIATAKTNALKATRKLITGSGSKGGKFRVSAPTKLRKVTPVSSSGVKKLAPIKLRRVS